MAVRATEGGYSFIIGATASGFAFSGVQQLPDTDSAKYVVWESGLTYRTLNKATGIVEYSGANAFDAIKYAQSGAFAVNNTLVPFSGDTEIVIKDGEYRFASGFTGFDLHEKTTVMMGRGTRLIVPPRYSGYVFSLPSRVEHVYIKGGVFYESGTRANLEASGRQWTGIYCMSSGAGVYFSKIEDVEMWNPGIAFHIDCYADGWFNGNTIRDCIIYSPTTAFKFSSVSGTIGAYSNDFQNVLTQSLSGITRAGVDADNMVGSRNTFIDCTMWDMAGSGTYSAHFGSGAINTIILNGALTWNNFYYSGEGARIIDAYRYTVFDTSGQFSNLDVTDRVDAENMGIGTRLYVRNIAFSGSAGAGILTLENLASGQAATVYMYPVSGQNNTSISMWDSIAFTERLLIQKTTQNAFNSMRQNSSGTMRPTVFQLQDLAATTTLEPLRLDISGNVEFNRSGGKPQWFSGNTSTTASGTAANSGAYTPAGYLTQRLGTRSIRIPFFD